MKKCFLVLANGSAFEGVRFGADIDAAGELVFTTSSSYMSTLTDPCYAGQIVLQTSPLIGNYGVISSEMDAKDCALSGYVVKEWCTEPENFQSEGDIDSFLKSHHIAGVCGVDTRQITRILREQGTMRAAIADGVTPELMAKLNAPEDAPAVAACAPCIHEATGTSKGNIALINCGAEHSVIGKLTDRGYTVHEFPYNAAIEQIMACSPIAAVLSDGPGDPEAASVPCAPDVMKSLPTLGIGLGHLLMALAQGGTTHKLHHGHRGANKPIQRTADGRVLICSLNQGYAAEAPQGATVSFINVNDGSVAGLDYGRSMSVQFVPDGAIPGIGTDFIYDEFLGRVVE